MTAENMAEEQPRDIDSGSSDSSPNFEKAKRNYFVNLALEARPALEAHRAHGMLDKDDSLERPLGNITEHCLVVAARARELADLVGLPENLKYDMTVAAAIHDIYKMDERPVIKAGNYSWDSFEEAEQQSHEKMTRVGLPPRTIELTQSFGHSAVLNLEKILRAQHIDDEGLAALILYYVDSYTSNTDWVDGSSDPLEVRLLLKAATNPIYKQLDAEGKQHFDGVPTYQKMFETGHQISEVLRNRISRHGHIDVEATNIPAYVDEVIKHHIVEAAAHDEN